MRRRDIINKEKIMVRKSYEQFGIDFFLRREETIIGESSRVFMASNTMMEEHETGAVVSPFINLQEETVQQLMDELWHLGIRPKEQQFTSEQIKAIDNHLQDMRAIVAEKIGVGFKE